MESVLGRHRNLIIFLGVLFLQALGLAVQVKRGGPDEQDTRLIRVWAVDAITPFERVLVRVQSGVSEIWQSYFSLRGVRAENRRLNEQIEEMRLAQVRLREDAEQAHRLQQLLAFKEQVIAKTVAAQVIGSSGSDLSKSIYIDKGSDDGVAQDMPVITASGVVGKVLRVYPSTSLVLLINDQSSGVGALLDKSRLQGVVHGTPNGELMLEHIMSDEKVAPGEIVLSSGGDQIFPKGFPIGTVTQVTPGREMFLNIKVKPAADLNRLEEVLVVAAKQERESVAGNGNRTRAADILAQRLPSVPDKPAAPAVSAVNPVTGKPQTGSQAKASINPSTAATNATLVASPGVAPKTASPGTMQNANAATQSTKIDATKKREAATIAGDSATKSKTAAVNASYPQVPPRQEATPTKPQAKSLSQTPSPQSASGEDTPH